MNKTSNELETGSHDPQYVMLGRPAEDEVSLIDLWLVLVKRKKVFLYVMLLSLIVGFLFASSRPSMYEYSTSIEIGVRSGGAAIESTQTVLAKLQRGYIPQVLASYNAGSTDKAKIIDVEAAVAQGSNIILLSISGAERDEDVYIQLLNSVVEKIKLDHKRVSSLIENDMKLSIQKRENMGSQLVGELLLMQSQMKRLDQKEALFNTRIDKLSEFVTSNEKLRQSASKSKGDQGATLTLMMLDNELRSGRVLLAKLEDQSYIHLANERGVLRNQISVNEKKQLENKQVTDQYKAQLDNLPETRAIVEPLKSLNPMGISKKLILILFFVVGFIGSLIAVFVIEFLEKAKVAQLER